MTYRADHANAGSPEFPWVLRDDAGEIVGPCMTEAEAKELAAGINLLRELKVIPDERRRHRAIVTALRDAYHS